MGNSQPVMGSLDIRIERVVCLKLSSTILLTISPTSHAARPDIDADVRVRPTSRRHLRHRRRSPSKESQHVGGQQARVRNDHVSDAAGFENLSGWIR
jgi:hypothetical protein